MINEVKPSLSVEAACEAVWQLLDDARLPAGHWEGELSASALSTATAISTLSFYLADSKSDASLFSAVTQQVNQGLTWLVGHQNEDGGWGDTSLNYSNISTTMLSVAAFHAAGRVEALHLPIELAQRYIDSKGGIDGLRKRYGKDKTFAVPILANAAMSGIVSWKEVSALPFELACVPQRFYHWMQMPVVSYAIPALVAIGQAKFILDPPWDPFRRMIRRASIGRSLRVLEQMQPASGGYLEAVPLTSFVSMALIKSGRADHPVVKNGIRFLMESFRQVGEEKGNWPIDTNLATWNTTLTINAFANRPGKFQRQLIEDDQMRPVATSTSGSEPSTVGGSPNRSKRWADCLTWLLECQNKTVHPLSGAAAGGWGWSDLSGAVPDADDTPGALLALRHFVDYGEFDDAETARIRAAVELGIDWLIKLQNRDKGWPTFCRGWGKLPFDRSGADITAHAIRGLMAWKIEFGSARLERAIDSGFGYLARHQQNDGSWLPLWFGNQDRCDESNPCYGTVKVLMAYRNANSFDTNEAQFGLRWIREHQNPDGGWGGGASVAWSDQRLGRSSVEETALCTEILLEDDHLDSVKAANRGIGWLVDAVESGNIDTCWPIGFYFAKLWYFEKLYPLIFACSALGRAVTLNETRLT